MICVYRQVDKQSLNFKFEMKQHSCFLASGAMNSGG